MKKVFLALFALVYVEIDSLMIGKEDFSWKTNWPRAYLEVVY